MAAGDAADDVSVDPHFRPRYPLEQDPHSTVTDFARLRGWSTSAPLSTAMW